MVPSRRWTCQSSGRLSVRRCEELASMTDSDIDLIFLRGAQMGHCARQSLCAAEGSRKGISTKNVFLSETHCFSWR